VAVAMTRSDGGELVSLSPKATASKSHYAWQGDDIASKGSIVRRVMPVKSVRFIADFLSGSSSSL
jgi:hypothetical protein